MGWGGDEIHNGSYGGITGGMGGAGTGERPEEVNPQRGQGDQDGKLGGGD